LPVIKRRRSGQQLPATAVKAQYLPVRVHEVPIYNPHYLAGLTAYTQAAESPLTPLRGREPVPVKYGYQPAHDFYTAMLNLYKEAALVKVTGETVVLKVGMSVWPEKTVFKVH
jgi:hypothetical protein